MDGTEKERERGEEGEREKDEQPKYNSEAPGPPWVKTLLGPPDQNPGSTPVGPSL